MYALGALSETTETALRQALPPCYSLEFDRDCIQEANPEGYPGCREVLQAYSEDFDTAGQLVDQLPYCAASLALRDKLIYAAGGLLMGALVGVLLS